MIIILPLLSGKYITFYNSAVLLHIILPSIHTFLNKLNQPKQIINNNATISDSIIMYAFVATTLLFIHILLNKFNQITKKIYFNNI